MVVAGGLHSKWHAGIKYGAWLQKVTCGVQCKGLHGKRGVSGVAYHQALNPRQPTLPSHTGGGEAVGFSRTLVGAVAGSSVKLLVPLRKRRAHALILVCVMLRLWGLLLLYVGLLATLCSLILTPKTLIPDSLNCDP